MLLSLVVVVVAAVAVVWFLLERRESRRRAAGLAGHGGIRLIFAATGLLLMLFSGGCSAVFLWGWIAEGAPASGYVTWQAIASLGGPPFAAGLIIWWLSMRRKSG